MKPKTQRMFSGAHQYHKLDIATGQLETAIRLFLQDGCDMFSAITLAAAAGEILHQLVLNAGKKPFVDVVVKVNDFNSPGQTPSRSAVMSHIHRLLNFGHLKHLDKGQDELITFDAEECALAAILKAVADYKTLTGELSPAMKALYAWTYQNLDSAEIMRKCEDEAPPKLKRELEGG